VPAEDRFDEVSARLEHILKKSLRYVEWETWILNVYLKRNVRYELLIEVLGMYV
jgi:hypothetical protein